MKKRYIRALGLVIALALSLSLAACRGQNVREVTPDWPVPTETETDPALRGTWAVYWYLCGSDLETNGGFATTDLLEMMEVTLPENVKVVIETGGAQEWQNDTVGSDALGRYLYSGNTLTQISEEPDANMSDPNTLADFLQFCNANYPAERQVVILWDHGGGSLGGVICDERASGDAISLPELKSVFSAAPASSGQYEIIGFDACLMATIETMDSIDEYARYMVAAEESEPGCGWEYSGLFSALAADTTMDGAGLGKAICDTFYAGCAALESESMATLSVLDLKKAPAMLEAFRSLGDEALIESVKTREEYLSGFSGAALNAENYGGNNRQTGYFNMMDIGDFLDNAGESLLPKGSAAVREALSELVVYQIKGELRSRANGLACYYSYDGDQEMLKTYADAAECDGFEYFYEYALTGDLSAEGRAYVKKVQASSGEPMTEVQTLTPALNLAGFPLQLQNGRYVLDLGSSANNLAGVYLHVMYFSEFDGQIDYIDDMGASHAVDVSRQNEGIFTDTFNGRWVAAREAGFEAYSNPVYLAVVDRRPGEYTIYVTPVLLGSVGNLPGEDYLLYLYFDETQGIYEILGAKKSMDAESGMADKELRKLVPGDILIPVQLMSRRQEDGSFPELDWAKPTPEELEYGGAFMLSENAEFYEQLYLDGYYRITFEMVDYSGNIYESEAGWYKCDASGNPMAVSESEIPGIGG